MTEQAIKPLVWREPDDGLGHEDVAFVADGIGGRYSICPPKRVQTLTDPDFRDRQIEIEGVLHWKALLWWAHDEYSFAECESIDAAKAEAEADWQVRARLALFGEN